MDKKIYVYANDTEMSKIIEKTLRDKLVKSGLRVYEDYDESTELIICIGGDGTLLRLVQEFDFPRTPALLPYLGWLLAVYAYGYGHVRGGAGATCARVFPGPARRRLGRNAGLA